MKRRTLITLAAAGATRRALFPSPPLGKHKAIALDAFTTLDPRPIATLAEEVSPGKGAVLIDLWRMRQFEYTWLRTLTRSYVDFQQVTEDSLVFAAKALALDLPAQKRQRLLQCFFEFKAWSDARAALQRLRNAGIRLVFLSNFTGQMLSAAVESCGLQGLMEPHLSTDRVRAFKPDPRAYQMAVDALKLDRHEILYAAFAGWDAAGAKSFGYPTFWVNRMRQPVEELGFAPDAVGHDLDDLARHVIEARARP